MARPTLAGTVRNPLTNLGTSFSTVRVVVDGFPALVELNLDPIHDATPHVHILLATWIPGMAEGSPDTTSTAFPRPVWPVLDVLRDLGFTVEMTSAGLLARQDAAHAQHFVANPTALTNLTAALAHLAHVARSCSSAAPPG